MQRTVCSRLRFCCEILDFCMIPTRRVRRDQPSAVEAVSLALDAVEEDIIWVGNQLK